MVRVLCLNDFNEVSISTPKMRNQLKESVGILKIKEYAKAFNRLQTNKSLLKFILKTLFS